MLIALIAILVTLPIRGQSDRPFVYPEVGGNLPAQPIGANDLIAVFVYGAPEFSRTIRVGTDGLIRLPMLKKRIQAEGLYPADLETSLADSLQEEHVLVDASVTVTIAEYHSRPISVAGAVRKPIVFQASAPVTLLEAIARAEGLREDAGSEILVSSSQAAPEGSPAALTRRIPVRSLFDNTDPALNLQLSGGEEIRVPEVSKIYVIGNVRKPGAFPVQSGGDTTLLELLALAEGLAPFATKEAYIYRRDAAGIKNEIPVPLEKVMKRQSPDVALLANDILYIPDNKRRRLTSTTLERLASFGSSTATGVIVYH
jgi:polysaccharide export outer membrane protein